MFRRSSWILLLACSLAFISVFLMEPLGAFAATQQSARQQHTSFAQLSKEYPYPCTFNDNWYVVIDAPANAYYCGQGYTGIYVKNVTGVYNNSGWNVWIRWYRGGSGHNCTISSQKNAANFPGTGAVLITQLDINGNNGPQCPR